MRELPVDGERTLQQMVSKRGSSLSLHRFAALIVMCLTMPINRFFWLVLWIRWTSLTDSKYEFWENTGKQWHHFRLTLLLETYSICSNWIWPSSLKLFSKAVLLTPSWWASRGQTGYPSTPSYVMTTLDSLAFSTHPAGYHTLHLRLEGLLCLCVSICVPVVLLAVY